MNHCLRHFEEPVAGVCRTCEHPFCERCLVFSFGPRKPPYCVGCALQASGVHLGGRVLIRKAGMEEPADAAAPAAGVDRRMARAQRRTEKATARAERTSGRSRGRGGSQEEEPTKEQVAARVGAAQDTFVPAPGELAGHRFQLSPIHQSV